MNAVYFVRLPDGGLAPGRVLETHRLWERRRHDALPHVSADLTPSRTETRVVGLLAIADRSMRGGLPEHLEALRQARRLVLADDPDEARHGLMTYEEELMGLREPDLDDRTLRSRMRARQITVIDPDRLRPMPERSR